MRIACVGDIGIDKTIDCEAVKLASEGPIPVMREKSVRHSFAMAANVATGCKALGAEVLLCGVVGVDSFQNEISKSLMESEIENGLEYRQEYGTTTKTRYYDVRDGQRHLVARIDRDCAYQCTSEDSRRFVNKLQDWKPDAVIIQDHGKGVVNSDLVKLITQEQWATFIDPCKTTHPAMNTAVWVGSRQEVPQAVWDRYGNCTVSEIVIEKMGKDGVRLDHPNSVTSKFDMPAYRKHPVDSCGAGDQFIAALVVERLLGRSWKESCHIASIAAAIKCGRYGTKPVTYDEIHEYQIVSMRR